mgnify:CR=1 FL=1
MKTGGMRRFFSVVLLLSVAVAAWACSRGGGGEVVVYTSLDRNLAEPVLREFERQSGIRVKAVYDTEATKTTGLANRLAAERAHPQADVFWNSETLRTVLLKRSGVLAPYRSPVAEGIPARFKDSEGYWTGFAARARVIIVNTNLIAPRDEPKSIRDLTDARWKGKAAMALPLFGTTATHGAALFSAWGQDEARAFFSRVKANDVAILLGNATVKNRVAEGAFAWGFTDTDDVSAGLEDGRPVKMVFPDQGGIGSLLIPNTVALIAGAPHPNEGRKLIDYLLSEAVEARLARGRGAQIPLRRGLAPPPRIPEASSLRWMEADFERVGEAFETSKAFFEKEWAR